MGIGSKLVTYGTVAVLSFGAGMYSMDYYQKHRDTSYSIGLNRDNFGVKKKKGIDRKVEDAVEKIKKIGDDKRK